MDRSKDAVAKELAEAHFTVDEGVQRIFRVVAPSEVEAQANEPIKLLEVNDRTFSAGIQPLFFGPSPANGIDYASVIIDVTPTEFDRVMRNELRLPNGWSLGAEFSRPAMAEQ